MYPDWVVNGALGILVVWLAVLSFFIWQQSRFLKLLFPKSGSRDVRKKFEEVLKAVESVEGKITGLDSRLEEIRKDGLKHIQRIELLRFNPFGDTGGDQSFTACLLDKDGNGIVVTSMHARTGTRVFGKEVRGGQGGRYRLSKEEEQVVKKALSE
ncbi:DUF4446 family protein [Candidatus Daviesbacteria bacterium]|nr:DUF4446 family protein [Candidatus Daviesbacteria bacterium]